MKLTDYQIRAKDAIFDKLKVYDSTLLELATGLGKTVIAAHVAHEWQDRRVLFIAHRDELIRQAAEKLHAVTGENVVIEMGRERAEDSIYGSSKIMVASVQTLSRAKRRERFHPEEFGLIIVDEGHHAVAKSYREVLEYFKNSKKLFITATPIRADEVGMENVCQSIAFQYGIEKAIDDGWLVMVNQVVVKVDGLDFSKARTLGDDFNQGDLERILTEEAPLHEMCASAFKIIGDRPALWFCVSVAHSRATAEVLGRYVDSNRVKFLSGDTPIEERREAVNDYKIGKIQHLVNCALFLEGFDAPATSAIVMGRPTKSIGLYCLDSKTEVLTECGWVGLDQWDSISSGQRAAGYNLETGDVEWTPIVAKYRRPLRPEEKIFSLQGPQFDLRVSQDHRLLYRSVTERRANDLFKLLPAEIVARRQAAYHIPVSGIQKSVGVPLTDDELRFVGWHLTDGTISKTTGQFLLRQAAHQPWLGEIESCLVGCGFKFRRRDYIRNTNFKIGAETVEYSISKGKPRGTQKDKRGWGDLAPYIDKDFSPLLEGVSPRQLGVLLHAMHLGDGFKFPNETWTQRSYHIATGNKTMADRLQSLCVRRGFKCNIATSTKGRKNPVYILNIKKKSFAFVGGQGCLDRPVLSESPKIAGETLWCVTTGTSTIVTRRNGKVTFMGQTQVLGRGTRPLPGTVYHLETAEERKAAIAASGKANMLVIDYAGNAGKHHIVQAADVLTGKHDAPVVAYAKKTMALEGKPVSIVEALARAEAETLLLHEQAEFRKKIVANATYKTEAKDLFIKRYQGQQKPVKKYRDSGDNPSQKQIDYAVQLGCNRQFAEQCGRKQLSAIIGKMLEKKRKAQ